MIFGSCKNHSLPDEKPIITVSIEPQRWMLQRITGNRMEVRTLLARGGNPENYEPSFSHLADLENSSLYIKMGNLGFEQALIGRITSGFPNLTIVNASDSIDLIIDNHGHDNGIDPHVWSSTQNARIISRNMLRAVKNLDPKNAKFYDTNYAELIQTIDSVDAVCRELVADLPSATFVVWHPSLSYFARDYNLHQLSVGAEGKEHSIINTRRVLDLINQENAAVMLVQQDFDVAKAAAIINGDNQLRVESINPLNYEWDKELVHTAKAIAGR